MTAEPDFDDNLGCTLEISPRCQDEPAVGVRIGEGTWNGHAACRPCLPGALADGWTIVPEAEMPS